MSLDGMILAFIVQHNSLQGNVYGLPEEERP